MTTSEDANYISEAEYRRRVRQLAHDIRSPLSVICMGLEVLGDVRNNEEKFDAMRRMIQTAGTELKDLVDTLAPSVSAGETQR